MEGEQRLQLCCALYDFTNIFLSYLYFALFVISAMILLRLRGSPWTWQKIFHSIIILGALVRSVFFSIQPWLREGLFDFRNQGNIILNTIPTLLFISTYMLLIFFWAELIHTGGKEKGGHHISGAQLNHLKFIYFGINGVGYGVFITLYILNNTIYQPIYSREATVVTPIEKAIWVMVGAMALCTAAGFLFYGLRLLWILTRGPWKLMSQVRRGIIVKVAVIALLCTLAFGFRAIFDIMSVIWRDYFASTWWVNGLFFSCSRNCPFAFNVSDFAHA
jgi:hypothetical protein